MRAAASVPESSSPRRHWTKGMDRSTISDSSFRSRPSGQREKGIPDFRVERDGNLSGGDDAARLERVLPIRLSIELDEVATGRDPTRSHAVRRRTELHSVQRIVEGLVRVLVERVEVVADRSAEEDRILRDQADGGAEVLEADLGDVESVDDDLATAGQREAGSASC